MCAFAQYQKTTSRNFWPILLVRLSPSTNIPGFCVKAGLGWVLFHSIASRKTRNFVLPVLVNPVLYPLLILVPETCRPGRGRAALPAGSTWPPSRSRCRHTSRRLLYSAALFDSFLPSFSFLASSLSRNDTFAVRTHFAIVTSLTLYDFKQSAL